MKRLSVSYNGKNFVEIKLRPAYHYLCGEDAMRNKTGVIKMPTVPLATIRYSEMEGYVYCKDVTGGITRLDADNLSLLALALTQAEWLTLKSALQHPGNEFTITAVIDIR